MRSLVLVLAVAVLGCGSSDTCSQNPAGCADAGNGSCTGQCLPSAGGDYVYLWSGPAGSTPPACPAVLGSGSGTTTGFLDAPPTTVTCSPKCDCTASENLCGLATMTASTAACPGGGGAPFDAPEAWDGACSTMDPVNSAKSVTVDPPFVGFQGQCAPSTPSVVAVEGGATIAVTCQGFAPAVTGVCLGAFQDCTYPNAPGFTVCAAVALTAGEGCPSGWPVQHTLFRPACTCACGPSVGDTCSATVTAYEDDACSKPVGSGTLTSNDPATCFPIVPSPSALGSKSATVTYTPGMCAPTLTPIGSETLCCLE